VFRLSTLYHLIVSNRTGMTQLKIYYRIYRCPPPVPIVDHINPCGVTLSHFLKINFNTWKLKGQLDATDWLLYCKTYFSLNMFRAPLCPSSGAQELYRWLRLVVFGALVYRSLVWSGAVGYVSGLRGVSRETSRKPQVATICITLELLMMGIMVPETC